MDCNKHKNEKYIILCLDCVSLCCGECVEFEHPKHLLKSLKTVNKFNCPTHIDQTLSEYCKCCNLIICNKCISINHNHLNNETNLISFPFTKLSLVSSLSSLSFSTSFSFSNNQNTPVILEKTISNSPSITNTDTNTETTFIPDQPKIKLPEPMGILVQTGSYENLVSKEYMGMFNDRLTSSNPKIYLQGDADKNPTHSPSNAWMGSSFLYGSNGVKQNLDKALHYLQKAADMDHPKACFDLFKLHLDQDDYTRGAHYLEKSLKLCYEDALITTANYCFDGVFLLQDYQKAFNLYLMCASMKVNSLPSYCNIGYCYYMGRGIENDDFEAYSLFYYSSQQFQNQSNEIAYYFLGDCNYVGRGIIPNEKNYYQAYQYFNKSLSFNQYYHPSLDALGQCYFRGHGIQQNFQQAKHYFTEAKKYGSTIAERNLIAVMKCLDTKKQLSKLEIDKVIADNLNQDFSKRILDSLKHKHSDTTIADKTAKQLSDKARIYKNVAHNTPNSPSSSSGNKKSNSMLSDFANSVVFGDSKPYKKMSFETRGYSVFDLFD